MLAARDAEERGEPTAPPDNFYRTLMNGTLLLPVPPEHGDEAKSALEAAVNDDEEVEVSVLLAADADGKPMSVCFASVAALVRLVAARDGSLPLPARIAIANMAAAGLPAIMDPAGPIPYRFEPDELAALAAGRLPGPMSRLLDRRSIARSGCGCPGRRPIALERRCRVPGRTDVDAAWLVESESGRAGRLMLGLLGWRRALGDRRRAGRAPTSSGSRSRCSHRSAPWPTRSTAGTRDERCCASARRGWRASRSTVPRSGTHSTPSSSPPCRTFDALADEPPETLRAVVLAGEGNAFCAGADIAWMRALGGLSVEENEADAAAHAEMLATIDNCPVPVMARSMARRSAAGWASAPWRTSRWPPRTTIFGFTEIRLGILPAVIGPFVLAEIGEGPARALFLTGERFGAERALRIGLVPEVARR